MNNLLKIFLIFNLFSSATSSVNNSSLPLLEENFVVGQNSSELTERGEPITLVGGTTVQGIVQGKGPSETYQRACALSFPVKNSAGRLGFLTSSACSNTDFFVEDANSNLIQVGIVLLPHNFAPNQGLDYTFVHVYDGYWEEGQSERILFSEYLNNNERVDRLLEMTSPTQPPFTNLEVCAFGGLNGGLKEGMACGEILEFNVTIQVPTPGSDGKEFVNFANVVKVNMTNDYDLGYMGAPVYIPGQIPFTSQVIAHPVGQVVETLAQYNNEDDQDKKIWYYIPIDRILQDSGVELLLGDFSSNEQVPMGGKSSKSKLQERQVFFLYGGAFINVRRQGRVTSARTCTLGFAVKKIAGSGQFDQGYLTAASCISTRMNTGADEAFIIDVNGNEVVVGNIGRIKRGYDPQLGHDYTVIKVGADYWNPQSMNIFIDSIDNPYLVPVLSPVSPAKGAQVCFVGSYSGLVCGYVYDLDKTMARTSPWHNAQRQYPEEYFQHMVWVFMLTNTKAQNDGKRDNDRGAPVFVPIWNPIQPPNQPKQLIGAQPVGIFAEYALFEVKVFGQVIGNDDKYFSYTPIERIFQDTPDLRLIQTPHGNTLNSGKEMSSKRAGESGDALARQ